jgi:hypothetical protein
MNRLLVLFLFMLGGCSHSVHLVNISDFDQKQKFTAGNWIQVETQQTVVMGFKFDTDYVELAHIELIKKCKDGDIQGITTRYSTSHGFFHWKNKINMQGLCLK